MDLQEEAAAAAGDTQPDPYKMIIEQCADEMNRSSRGIAVKKQLRKFLNGPVSQLDGNHWESVEALLRLYRRGYQGSVLEALK
jgi:hypothetical protein